MKTTRGIKFEPSWTIAALAGVAFLITGSNLLAQGHPFAAGQTLPGAGFRASGSAVAPAVYYSNSGYKSSGSAGTSRYHSSSGYGHSGSSYHSVYPVYRAPIYPLAYYAYPYYVTPSYGFVGDPGLVGPGDAPVPDQSVYAELDVLHQQLDQLRADQQYLASGPPPPYPDALEAPAEKAPPALVLVFRDGTRTEVQDYAVVGQTFWDLSSHGTRKFPVSQLDLQASIQANAARGLEFPEVK